MGESGGRVGRREAGRGVWGRGRRVWAWERMRPVAAGHTTLTPIPAPSNFPCAAWISISKIAVTNPSSPIGLDGPQPGVRGQKSPYSDLHSCLHLLCARYNAGHLAFLFQFQLRIGVPITFPGTVFKGMYNRIAGVSCSDHRGKHRIRIAALKMCV